VKVRRLAWCGLLVSSPWHLFCKCSCMFNLYVKTSTRLARLMQLLCLLGFGYSNGHAQLVPLVNGGAVTSSASANAQSNLAAMTQQIGKWYLKTYEINPKEVILNALDPRLQVPSCTKPLSIDNPFASRETVRVRCSEPVWQLYVQVSLTGVNQQTVPVLSNSSSTSGGALINVSRAKPCGVWTARRRSRFGVATT
jgi:hypothetical protein